MSHTKSIFEEISYVLDMDSWGKLHNHSSRVSYISKVTNLEFWHFAFLAGEPGTESSLNLDSRSAKER